MAPQHRDWQIVTFEHGMLDRVAALHVANGSTFDENVWQWRYTRSPAATNGTFIDLAVDGDRTVGHYAVQLQAFNYRGRRLIAAHSLDSLTHPEHRRRGVFTTLARHLYGRLKLAGIPFVIGFPNATSQPGVLNHLDWVRLRPKFQLVAPLGSVRWDPGLLPEPLAGWIGEALRRVKQVGTSVVLTAAGTFLPGLSVAEVQQPSEAVDQLWKRAKDSAVLSVCRDRAYLDWRYCLCPTGEYRLFEVRRNGALTGFGAITRPQLLNQRTTSHIMELIVEPGDAPSLVALLGAIQEAQLGERAGFSQALCPPSRWELPYLLGAGFIRVPDSFSNYLAIEAALHLQDEPRPNELYDSKSWLVSFGDTDYV